MHIKRDAQSITKTKPQKAPEQAEEQSSSKQASDGNDTVTNLRRKRRSVTATATTTEFRGETFPQRLN